VVSEQILIGVLGGAIVVLLMAVAFLLGSRGRGPSRTKPELPPIALPASLEALRPTLEGLQAQVEAVRQSVGDLQRTAAKQEGRLGQEDQAWHAIQQVQSSLTALGQLPQLQQSLQEQVAGALRDLEAIKSRQPRDEAAYGMLQRLSAVLLGSATAGAAGERVVSELLGELPPEWLVNDYKVANKPVEFAIQLPDGLILPIDSKVVAKSELQALDAAQDAAQREPLERVIRSTVLEHAKAVRQYLDGRSPGFGIITVPDGAYRLCGSVRVDAYQKHRALLVPYSLLAPFVLMVYEQHRRGGVDLESARVAHLLADAETHLERAAQVLNGHLGDAFTRLSNGRDSLSRELGEAASALSLLRQAATPHE
jgi:DNA recombination protein RmuC